MKNSNQESAMEKGLMSGLFGKYVINLLDLVYTKKTEELFPSEIMEKISISGLNSDLNRF